MCEHFLTVQVNSWFTPKETAKALTIMNVLGKRMNLSACEGECLLKRQCLQQTEHQQSVTVKSNPCLLLHRRDPQLQLDCNPHLGNLKSPPVFFGCLCDTLRLLSTEFRTFIYSSGYTWSFTKFNSLPLSNWLTRFIGAMWITVFLYSHLWFSVHTPYIASSPWHVFIEMLFLFVLHWNGQNI